MIDDSMRSTSLQPKDEGAVRLLDDWFDPIEADLRDRARQFTRG